MLNKTNVQACPHLPATLHCNISMYTQTKLCIILIIPSVWLLTYFTTPSDHTHSTTIVNRLDFMHIIFSINNIHVPTAFSRPYGRI